MTINKKTYFVEPSVPTNQARLSSTKQAISNSTTIILSNQPSKKSESQNGPQVIDYPNKYNSANKYNGELKEQDNFDKQNTVNKQQHRAFINESIDSQVKNPIRLSFQLMTRAEPVAMVIKTVTSLLAIKAPADEILIVDNNHTKTELYEPLAKFCNGLDPKLNVHFYHIDAVAGFKAGALNLALGLMDPNATHIVVVDSDYQALPQARASIAHAIRHYPTHTLLQFPQFYRDSGRVDVHSELNHYFNYHLYRRFNRERALSTGTYAVIRRDALIGLGGWSGASITEDAQMGVLMHRQGLRSQFIPEVIATGLLPTTLSDLMAQRRRWIYGNMQVLNTYFFGITTVSDRSSLSNNSSSKQSKALQGRSTAQNQSIKERLTYVRAHLSQLSAWVNFTGIFILLHIATLLIVCAALLLSFNIDLLALLTPLYVVYVGYTLFLGRRLWAYLQDEAPLNQQVNGNIKPSLSRRLHAWAFHLNFWELGALSWWPVLWGREKPFICTPKQGDERTRRSVNFANIAALPKLIFILSALTAIIVSPFSPLYVPLLFICAVAVCLLKIWAAKVIMSNYSYAKPSNVLQKPSLQDNKNVAGTIKTIANKRTIQNSTQLHPKQANPSLLSSLKSTSKDDNTVNL